MMNSLEIPVRTELQSDGKTYVLVQMLVDGKPLVDFHSYSLDLSEFRRSLEDDGEFFLIACSCGDTGCAGIESGVSVRHIENTVQLTLSQPIVRKLIFSDRDYQFAFSEALQRIHELTLDNTDPKFEIWPLQNALVIEN